MCSHPGSSRCVPSRATSLPQGTAVGTPPARRGLIASVLPLAAAVLLAALLALHATRVLHAVVRALHAGWRVFVAAALFEAASISRSVLLMHRVVGRASERLPFKDSYDIALAGNVAMRLVPTACRRAALRSPCGRCALEAFGRGI